ncbi:MAG: pre-peptidase C-terminal domain-containing protein [Xenococcus sp. MO_188.B8]|nr:pre-peptidase C-terminal domain-containing protein [Xenococcus sp. MO_188.B8]
MIVEPNDIILEANDTGLTSANSGNFVTEGFIGDSPNITRSQDDVDLFQVQLDLGDHLTIDIDTPNSNLDSVLRLFDSEGNQVAVNDDFDSLDSLISFDASVSDIYYIGVSSYSNFDYNPFVAGSGTGYSTGEYNLNINLTAVESLDGTEGDDILIGTPENEIINGLGGNDVLQGEAGDDSLEGGTGDDTIGGADGNDLLLGGDSNDILYGGDHHDTIEGNSGDDILSGGRGRDSLLGGDGNDTLEGNPDNDNLVGNRGNDLLSGGHGNDNLNGHDGHDRLYGGFGNDTLRGGNGNDILQGAIGNDFLTGGAGADQFILTSGHGGETIKDFEDDLDQFVLGTGLTFDNLKILSSGSDTIIIDNNIVLAVVENTQAFVIGVEDFIFRV